MNLMVYALGLEASTRYFDVLHLLFEHFMSNFIVSDLTQELFPGVSDLWCFLSLFPSPWFTKSNCSSYVCKIFLLTWLSLLVHIIDCWRLKIFNLSLDVNYNEPICGVEEANLNLFDDGLEKDKLNILFLNPFVYS